MLEMKFSITLEEKR